LGKGQFGEVTILGYIPTAQISKPNYGGATNVHLAIEAKFSYSKHVHFEGKRNL
jgi:hypothetical protein